MNCWVDKFSVLHQNVKVASASYFDLFPKNVVDVLNGGFWNKPGLQRAAPPDLGERRLFVSSSSRSLLILRLSSSRLGLFLPFSCRQAMKGHDAKSWSTSLTLFRNAGRCELADVGVPVVSEALPLEVDYWSSEDSREALHGRTNARLVPVAISRRITMDIKKTTATAKIQPVPFNRRTDGVPCGINRTSIIKFSRGV